MSSVSRDTTKSNPADAALLRVIEAATLFENAQPEETLEWALDEFGASVTLATGFGAEGVALIDMSAKLNRSIDIFFLDTSFLFQETYELRRRLEDRYGIAIRSYETNLTPARQEITFGPKLWSTDPDLCCRLRKLEPLGEALKDRRAWITAIRRDQTIERSAAQVVEWDYQWKLVKINPLARWSKKEVWEYISRNNVPYNPLHDQGYPSIGCTHCTIAIGGSEGERAGRWPGREKRECGIHLTPRSLADGSAQMQSAQPTSDAVCESNSASTDIAPKDVVPPASVDSALRTNYEKQPEGRTGNIEIMHSLRIRGFMNETTLLNRSTGMVIWLTGLSGAGKTTLAHVLARRLVEQGLRVETLDGDEVRENLSSGLGFSKPDRDANVRRIGFVARLLARNGVVVLGAAISPYRQSRDDVRLSVENEGISFLEVFVRCPLDALIKRDVKGLYARALAGEIEHFTGISDPYEEPLSPDIIVDSSIDTVEEGARRILTRANELRSFALPQPVASVDSFTHSEA